MNGFKYPTGGRVCCAGQTGSVPFKPPSTARTEAQRIGADRGTKKGCPLAGASLGTLRCLRAALETGRADGRFLALHHLDRTMVVAMVAVRVVQVAVDQVVDVVTVRDGFVAATGAMDVAGLVAAAFVLGRAAVGVGGRDRDHVLVDVVAMRMVQVALKPLAAKSS